MCPGLLMLLSQYFMAMAGPRMASPAMYVVLPLAMLGKNQRLVYCELVPLQK
jgi:hypothetical protein